VGGGGGSGLVDVALNTIGAIVSDAGGLISQIADLVDLRDEEGGSYGGHAISDHVGKGDEYLQRRVRSSIVGNRFFGQGDLRAGAFSSLEAANKLVNSVISQNSAIVEAVVSGRIKGAKQISAFFDSPTGREAYALRPWDPSASISMRDTFGAAVIIFRNSATPRGFSILTAFPLFD
jgi:hypothetical protein